MMMEDSGIDSGDKINSICFETEFGTNDNCFIESDNSSNENVEVVFRNPCILSRGNTHTGPVATITPVVLTDDNNGNKGGVGGGGGVIGLDFETNSSHHHHDENFMFKSKDSEEKFNQISSCKILQRKLELKVERAKKNYNQLYEEKDPCSRSKSSTLIPISRLQIPGCQENVPLVEYNSNENSDDDDDDVGDAFFPSMKSKSNKKQDLTDTFSIQEMTIESDESDDSESQNLELLPPTKSDKAIEKILTCLCCVEDENQKSCVVM